MNDLRARAKLLGDDVKALKGHDYFSFPQPDPIDLRDFIERADLWEMKANIMLAYRHLEDARMRLGKVIQAQEGGVSCYDKPVPGPDATPYILAHPDEFDAETVRRARQSVVGGEPAAAAS